jgi:heme-degrading monooxygenase HmoA
MDQIGQPYTSGDWVVKEGNEQAFVDAWTEFLEWSLANVSGVQRAFLIQDAANPRHFVSFGSWDDLESVTAWRQNPEFADKLGKARALCEQFEARDYRLASTSKPGA